MKSNRRVLVWRSRLLPISETFILNHVNGLQRYVPRLAGLRAVHQMDLKGYDLLHVDSKYHRHPVTLASFRLLGRGGSLFKQIAAWKPDLIHAHFTTDAVDVLPVARRLNIPLVVTMHGMDVTKHDSTFLRSGPSGINYLFKRQALQRYANLFLPVSDYIRERAIEKGFPAERMQRHYLGMDLTTTSVDAVDAADRIGIVFVGRLVEKKRPDLVLEAALILRQLGMATPVTIIGDGPMMVDLRRHAEHEGLDVRFLGACPHSKVIEHLARARVFCMPSTQGHDGNNEGLPLVYLEAQYCGTPVAAFDQGPVGEAVVDRETGLLATDRDVAGLAKNIAKLLTNDKLWVRLSNAGRKRVEHEFDIVRQTELLEARYDTLLEEHP